jgi:hypothetical protein
LISLRHLSVPVAVALLAVSLAACSGGSSAAGPPTTTIPRRTDVTATIGTVSVPSPRPMVQFADDEQNGVLAAVEQYVHRATLAPLDGDGTGDLTEILSPATASSMSASDAEALADTDAPPATKKVDVSLEPVNITALVDENGAIDLVGTTLDLSVAAETAQGSLSIHRTGELVFVRENGAWKILGFTLVVERDGAALRSTPSTTSGSTP